MVVAGTVAVGAAGAADFDGASGVTVVGLPVTDLSDTVGCALMAVATNKNAAAVAAAFLEQIDNTNNRLICIGPVINVLQWRWPAAGWRPATLALFEPDTAPQNSLGSTEPAEIQRE